MIYIFCGMIIGSIAGLTGAGGALVAIPLFMQFLGMTLKEASVYSLLAVIAATAINYLLQRKFAQNRLAIGVIFFSAVGSFLMTPWKLVVPDIAIATLLASVALYSLYNVWTHRSRKDQPSETQAINLWLSIPTGLMVGALTTLTGLGGGVLLIPIFLRFYPFTDVEAVATSLLVITFSALLSLTAQLLGGFVIPFNLGLLYLVVGILGAAIALKVVLPTLSLEKVSLARKIVFSFVVLLAIIKVF